MQKWFYRAFGKSLFIFDAFWEDGSELQSKHTEGGVFVPIVTWDPLRPRMSSPKIKRRRSTNGLSQVDGI